MKMLTDFMTTDWICILMTTDQNWVCSLIYDHVQNCNVSTVACSSDLPVH